MKLNQIPNIISVIRILLVAPVVYCLLNQQFQVAWWLFVIAGISDGVDGYLARRFNWQTELGATLDPIGDKLLMVFSYLALGWLAQLPIWLVILVILRDVVIVSGTLFYRRLTGENELERMAAAKAWSIWEGHCATLHSNHEMVERFASPHMAMAMARIEAHFFINKAFIKPNQIIDNAHRLKDIPGTIVHGRYDMICPVNQAFALSDAWPSAKLEIIADAGHASSERGITDALVRATNRLAFHLESRQ